MIITSKDNKIVKYVRKLSQKKYRDEYGCFIVEGVRAVGDVLGYPGAETETVVVSESRCGDYPGAVVVSDEAFASMCETENGQGVLSVVRIPEPSPVTCDNVLFLDGVRDPGNLGTLIRTACAAGYRDVCLRACADPFSGKVVRSTMSAVIKVNLVPSDIGTLRALKSAGYKIYGADMDGRNIFGTGAAQGKTCVVVGGEANGITDEVRTLCDEIVAIPMDGDIESLNAAVSGGIIMYNLKFNKTR